MFGGRVKQFISRNLGHTVEINKKQQYLRDIVGSVPDHPNKVDTAIKWVTLFFFDFPVYIKAVFTLHWSVLSVQQPYVFKKMYKPLLKNGASVKHNKVKCDKTRPASIYNTSGLKLRFRVFL